MIYLNFVLIKKFVKNLAIFLLIFTWIFFGWPQAFDFPPKVQEAFAAAPTHINTAVSSNTTAATSHTVTMPTFIANDVVVVCLAATASVNPVGTYSTPSGWTAISGTGVNITSTSAVRLQCFYRLMQGGDPSTQAFTQETSSGFAAFASSYRGCDTTTPVQTSATNIGGANTSAIHPAVTTTVDNEMILRVVSQDDQESHTNSGITWRTPDQSVTNGISTPGNGTNINMGDQVKVTAGDTGTLTTTLGLTEEWGTYTIALNPVLIVAPDAPTLYPDDGGSNQIAFNNTKQNDTTPIVRASTTHTSTFDRFQVEFNAASDFSGTAYTETFSNTYSSGTPYNLQTTASLNLPSTDGITYYVRARASADGGTNYGDWSTGTWTYTYTSTAGDAQWFQTTDEQFNTGTLAGVNTNGSDQVILGTSITATGGTTSEAGGYKFHTFTSSGTFEVTAGSGNVEVFVVGGGAAGATGGTAGRGGGGAGGIVYDDAYAVTAGSYTVTVGAGGLTGGSSATSGSGGNSVFDTLTALGGGGSGPHATAGTAGGSGGGGSGYLGELGGAGNQPGSASGGFGNAGGASYNGGAAPGMQGGGGGAGAVGQTGQSGKGGDGGVGKEYSQFSSVGGSPAGWFAGGGGGGASTPTPGVAGAGGQGGGGAGGSGAVGTDGTANTGGGGGGSTSTGGAGGSGIVIVRYSTSGGSSGTIMSPEIDFDWVTSQSQWGEAAFGTTETNGDVKLRVYYTVSTACDTIVSDGILNGNSSGFDVSQSPISLTNLTPVATTYNKICLQATLTDVSGTPYLNDWTVSWSSGANQTPSVSAVNIAPDPITLIENSATNMTITATITDDDSCEDVFTNGSITAVLYRSGVGASCTVDDSNCYPNITLFEVDNTCNGGTSGDASGTVAVWFFADSTDASSTLYSGETWQAQVKAVDAANASSTNTDPLPPELNTLWAINVTSNINYGTVNPNENTSSTNQTATIKNTGNAAIDVEVSGANMTFSSFTIAVGNQKYATSTFTYSSCTVCTALSTIPVAYEVDLLKPTSSSTPITYDVFWGLAVPDGKPPGTYSGSITFTAIGD